MYYLKKMSYIEFSEESVKNTWYSESTADNWIHSWKSICLPHEVVSWETQQRHPSNNSSCSVDKTIDVISEGGSLQDTGEEAGVGHSYEDWILYCSWHCLIYGTVIKISSFTLTRRDDEEE